MVLTLFTSGLFTLFFEQKNFIIVKYINKLLS